MSIYHKLCLFTVLGSTLTLPAQAIDDRPGAAAHKQGDITAMRSELQALEATVLRLESRLALIEAQQRVPATNGALPLQGSTAAQDLEKAIQALLQDVTEQ